jgi:hypothetical protein
MSDPTPAPTPTPSPGLAATSIVAAESYVLRFLRYVWGKLGVVHSVVLAPFGLRTLLLIAVAAALLSLDVPLARAFGFSFGLVAAVLAFLHWFRKTQYPYLDFQPLIKKAEEHPIAAALVIVGFQCFFAAVLLAIILIAIK